MLNNSHGIVFGRNAAKKPTEQTKVQVSDVCIQVYKRRKLFARNRHRPHETHNTCLEHAPHIQFSVVNGAGAAIEIPRLEHCSRLVPEKAPLNPFRNCWLASEWRCICTVQFCIHLYHTYTNVRPHAFANSRSVRKGCGMLSPVARLHFRVQHTTILPTSSRCTSCVLVGVIKMQITNAPQSVKYTLKSSSKVVCRSCVWWPFVGASSGGPKLTISIIYAD